ncbi:MAG: TrbC/VirB2 family protein [Thermoanaerobaculia bacterium]|nr:TrbC/VirB2 family protein [Thermoanaerobaculia bacterium]
MRRLMTLAALFVAPLAHAGTTTGNLPWNGILDTLKTNITGPTATAILLIAIAVGALYWAFSDDNRGVFRMLKGVVAMGIVIALGTLLSALGVTATVM